MDPTGACHNNGRLGLSFTKIPQTQRTIVISMSFATVVEMSILLISKVSFIMTITVGKLFIHRVFPVSPVCFVIRKVGYGWEDITCSDG